MFGHSPLLRFRRLLPTSKRLPANRGAIDGPPQPSTGPSVEIGLSTVIIVGMGFETNTDNCIITVRFSPPGHRPRSIFKRQVSADPCQGGTSDLSIPGRPRNSISRRHCNVFLLWHGSNYKDQVTGSQCGSHLGKRPPRQANGCAQANGDHARSRTDPDNAERLTGIYGVRCRTSAEAPGRARWGVTAEVTAAPPAVGLTRIVATTRDALTARRPVPARYLIRMRSVFNHILLRSAHA